MKLQVKRYDGIPVRYRPGTSDEKILYEVIEFQTYRRVRKGFEIEQGEHWLDLGAHIGAFAVYCSLRGATAECYEPDPDCWNVLQRNLIGLEGCKGYNLAVTSSGRSQIDFYSSKNGSRGSIYKVFKTAPKSRVKNIHIRELCDKQFDGIKMDIEGAEHGILDGDYLPKCNKLVMEYHTSRDPSLENLRRRIGRLAETFDVVAYPPEIDEIVKEVRNQPPKYDRLIMCMKKAHT